MIATRLAILGCAWLPALVAAVPEGRAAVIDIPAEQDATLFGGAANTGHSSSGPGMFVGTDAMRLPKRGLIEFDVANYVPAGATVTSVTLNLTLGQIAGGGGGASGGPVSQSTIRLFAATTAWNGGSNGATGHPGPGFGGTGQGFQANPGDATWAYSSYNTTPWKTSGGGGDFVATESADAVVGSAIGSVFSWGSTAQLVTDVQGWLDGATANDGWLLKNDDETGQFSYRAFYTREGAAEQGVPQDAPQLVVAFTPAPEPAGLAVWLVGMAACGAVRLRRV